MWSRRVFCCTAYVCTVTAAAAQTPIGVLRPDADLAIPRHLSLARVQDAHLSPAGPLLIALQGPPVLLSLEDGEGARIIGASDSQPQGVLGFPVRFGWRHDTLWVCDFANENIRLFSADGTRTLGVIPTPRIRLGPYSTARPWAVLADGSFLGLEVLGGARYAFDAEKGRPMLRMARLERAADTIHTLGVRNAMLSITPPGMSSISTQQPWADNELWVVSRDGGTVFVVGRPVAINQRSSEYTLRAITPSGRRLFDRSFSYTPTPLPAEAIERQLDALLTSHIVEDFGSASAARTALRSALYQPPFLPPVTRVTAAADGTIWVQREDRESSRHWDVLSADGRLIKRVRGNTETEILEASGNVAWGVVSDGQQRRLVRFAVISGS